LSLRHANLHDEVDHFDYEAHYYVRFGRREKQLARPKVSNPPPEANLAVGFFF